MKKIILLIAGLTLGLFGFMTIGQQVQAVNLDSGFSNVQEDLASERSEYTKMTTYHIKNPKTNAYLWNGTHTKRLYNLKNYPTYTWYLVETGAYKGNSHWVKVTNFPQTKIGWIWTGYLKKGYNSKGYQVLTSRYAQPKYAGSKYHVTSKTKNVYLYDWTHTKVVANLKYYTAQTLTSINSIQVMHNGSKQWYYHFRIQNSQNKAVAGYVPANQVTAGKSTDYANKIQHYPNEFDSTADYSKYLKQNDNQKLARSVMALFPHTPVDYELSKAAAYNYSTASGLRFFSDYFSDNHVTGLDSKYTDLVSFDAVTNYLNKNPKASNAQKLTMIKSLLAKAGYPQAKRDTLSNDKLGIYFINNVKVYGHRQNWYGLVIAQPK